MNLPRVVIEFLRERGAPEELLAALSNVDAQAISARYSASESESNPMPATWWVARAPSGERVIAIVVHDPRLGQDLVHAVIVPPGAASIADIPREDLVGFLRRYPRAIEELPLLLAPQSAQPPPAVPGFRELDPNLVRAAAARLVGYRPPAAALARVLAAWGAANKVSPLSIADILKAALPNAPQPELEAAFLWVERAYLGAGADLSNARDELARALGLGAPPQGEPPEPGGAATLVGLLLEASAPREAALFAALELQRALGPHPAAGAVFVEIDPAAGLYAVVDLEAGEVRRAYATVDPRTKVEAFALREAVIGAAPVEVVVHVDPESGEPRYAARWAYRGEDWRELAVGPSTVQEMLARLSAGGFVQARRLAEDFLSAVLGYYRDSGLARVEALPAAPGFYWAEGKLVAAGVRADPPAPEELRAAWELLDELATKWWGHAQAKFASVLRWAAGAPFHYAVKQGALGRPAWIGYVFLHGPPDTGKSELARVLCYDLWGLEAEMESGATVDTVARLGRVLERWTFPTVVNEVSHLFREDRHEELVNMLKNAAERTVARGRYYGGTEYREVRARSPLVLTSNAMPLNDPAFLKRFALVIGFTYSEVVPRERQEQYNREVRPRLRALEAIGRYIAARVLRDGIPADLDFGRLLKESYREAFGAEPPAWLDLEAERGEEGPSVDEFRRAVLTFIAAEINNTYRQYHKMDEVNRPTLRERAESVLWEWYIPWIRATRAQGGDEVRIYYEILKALGNLVPGVTSLRALADLMGWKYDQHLPEKRGGRVTTVNVIRVPLDRFLAELEPAEVDGGAAGLQ